MRHSSNAVERGQKWRCSKKMEAKYIATAKVKCQVPALEWGAAIYGMFNIAWKLIANFLQRDDSIICFGRRIRKKAWPIRKDGPNCMRIVNSSIISKNIWYWCSDATNVLRNVNDFLRIGTLLSTTGNRHQIYLVNILIMHRNWENTRVSFSC